ncbi:hypothetical protein KSP40_PGU006571 [Platanthera guangdongensis]|uniref:Uncharacterized protein n=1 Tax=Platanthera guangdongensis TaxID=2320717 RepID=A0ABR2LHK9_9ASPA
MYLKALIQQDISNSSQNYGDVSSQGSCGMALSARPSDSRQNKEDNLDLDQESIMMMRSIWQSIQPGRRTMGGSSLADQVEGRS